MAANDPFELTAAEARALMDKGELSPLDLTESCLSRIDAHEDALRAWAHVDREGAVAAARRAGDELLVIGRKSPLHGIPIGIKDIYRTNGLPTEMGSRSWAGYVPNFDCTAVARLKQAGAIVLGKTVTTEFAMLQPSPTYNPWNPDHTPGGSSSGSGASVAARMTPLAIGSQTGGSVLRPAAYNGVVGLKPTLGRISCYGVLPISHVMDHPGTFTRSVEDAADFLQVIAGFDAFDPYTVDMPVPDYRAALDQPLSPPRIGLARGFFFDNADEETRRHTEQIAQRLADAGAIVEDVDVPESLADVRLHHKVIMDTDAATVHKDTYETRRDDIGPRTQEIIEHGLSTTGLEYSLALQYRQQLIAALVPLVQSWDALLTPCIPAPAPDRTTTGNMIMQVPWSITGLPTLGLPTGLSQGGLPLAIQLVTGPWEEERLLAVGRWCEGVLDTRWRPPLD